jgi:hypothetical protein
VSRHFVRFVSEYDAGAMLALNIFREQLLQDRALIEADPEPDVDVILDLLIRIARGIAEHGLAGPS